MKRKSILAIVLAFLVLTFTVMPLDTARLRVEASEAYQKVDSTSGTITAADVNLRTGPATTFDIICKLKKNQKLTVMGKLGNWYAVYVSTNGNVGAVSSQYVKLDKAAVSASDKQQSDKNTAAKTASKNTASKTAQTNDTKTAAVTEKVKDISYDEQVLLDLINSARKEKSLKALEFDAGLVKVARLKADDMKNNNYFSHTSKYYGSPFDMMKKYDVKFSAAGENIAGNSSAEKVVKAWLKEGSNNLVNEKFTHAGIGVVDSPTYGKLFVAMFITKK